MRRKEEVEQVKKKQAIKQQTFEYSYETEISILLPYLKIMPMTMRSKFLMGLKPFATKQQLSQTNKSLELLMSNLANDDTDNGKNIFLTQIFCRFLKLNKLREHFLANSKKAVSKDKTNQNLFDKEPSLASIQPFQPNIQRQSTKIDSTPIPIPQIINPNYENIIKMYKNFTDIHMNMQYKIRNLNQSYKFYSQPRFVTKLLDMHDLQSGFSEKGNVIMMTFQGSKIVGNRGFAFVSNSAIYWWEKNYQDFKSILPEINVQDKDNKDEKDKSKKKQTQKQQSKNAEEPQAPKYTQNFQLSYKLVGHHGKITSLSLSDDEYYLISAGTDKLIKLWCLRQKCLLAEYRGHTKTIWSVSFSKSGYFFLSGAADKLIKLWSTDDSIAQRIYIGHIEDVTKVDFLKNPDLFASASQDKTIRIWNTLTTQCLNTIKLEKSIINFKTSISGRYFAYCDIGGKINLYDLLKGEPISSFKVPQKQQSSSKTKYLKIHDITFSLDQKQLSCVSSKYIIIYSLDKICQKESKNLFIESGKQNKQRTVATKEVIYTGRDSNLVFCQYCSKGLLLVASTSIKKY